MCTGEPLYAPSVNLVNLLCTFDLHFPIYRSQAWTYQPRGAFLMRTLSGATERWRESAASSESPPSFWFNGNTELGIRRVHDKSDRPRDGR